MVSSATVTPVPHGMSAAACISFLVIPALKASRMKWPSATGSRVVL